jgi:hypothetical protein
LEYRGKALEKELEKGLEERGRGGRKGERVKEKDEKK